MWCWPPLLYGRRGGFRYLPSMKAIWQDISVNLASYLSGGKVSFIVKQGSTTIYGGTAYQSASGVCSVRLNEILADYLGRSTYSPEEVDGNIIKTFSLYVGTTQVWSEQILNCWDYRTSTFSSDMALSTLIKGDWVASQYKCKTMFYAGSPAVAYQEEITDTSDFTLDGLKCHKRTDICDPYILYYVCPKGGWSWLLLEGVRPVDNFTRNEYTNGNVREEYKVAVQRGWDCFTGRLQRPENIGELLGSPEVYLWSTAGEKKVIIKASNATGTSYKQNGKKPVEYTIRVELAKQEERR